MRAITNGAELRAARLKYGMSSQALEGAIEHILGWQPGAARRKVTKMDIDAEPIIDGVAQVFELCQRLVAVVAGVVDSGALGTPAELLTVHTTKEFWTEQFQDYLRANLLPDPPACLTADWWTATCREALDESEAEGTLLFTRPEAWEEDPE